MATITREYRIVNYRREAAAKSRNIRELAHNLRHHTPFSTGDVVYLPVKRKWGQVKESTSYGTTVALRQGDGSYGKKVRVPTEQVQARYNLMTKKQREALHGRHVAEVDAALADLRRRK